MTADPTTVTDTATAVMGRARPLTSRAAIQGLVIAELFDKDGVLKARSVTRNIVTAVGDRLYASRGAGLATSVVPVGMKLGGGSTAVAKTGAGAALVTYLANSQQAFDATFPSEAAGVASYKVTYAAGKATTASAITEVVIYTDATADATSTAANTVSRALLTGIGSKGASDTLAVTWTHTVLGS